MSDLAGADQRADTTQVADVVVVGSGPGGAAVARVLARAGARVWVVERGPRVAPSSFRPSAFAAMSRHYVDLGGRLALGRTLTPLAMARMVGGSSPINGAICWRLPEDIHRGWLDDDPGLGEALPWSAVVRAMDGVEDRLGVQPTPEALLGDKDRLMRAGAEALGLDHRPIRRNVDGCEALGLCLQGCPRGHKRSVDRTLLADAEAAGARVMTEVTVQAVEVHRGRAVGVVGRAAGGGRVRVVARHAVVVAAGAVDSPALLLASGIGAGPVGEGFQGHPGVAMIGRFDRPVHPWEGATQGYEVTGLRREGLKFETLAYPPALIAARVRGVGRDLARALQTLDHHVVWGAAIRSTARGRVRRVLGRTVVTWSPTAEDVARFRRGLAVMGRMMRAAGAVEVDPGVTGVPAAIRDEAGLEDLEHHGPTAPRAYRAVMTHLFGTCRLGTDPARSVVGPDFQHHHVRGLYVGDASVFPSNTGVNPQVSIMALGTLCGEAIAKAR